VGDALRGLEGFVFDITHGFRLLPATGSFSLTFYQHVLPAQLSRILYGAFEAMADEQGVRLLPADGQSVFSAYKSKVPAEKLRYTAPLLDLTPMQALSRWAEAASAWARTGRATGIVELTEPFTRAIAKQLGAERPPELTGLPLFLKLLDDALTLVRHDEIAVRARLLCDLLDAAAAQADRWPQLTPLVPLLRSIGASSAALCRSWPAEPICHPGYLQSQVEAAAWLADRERIVEAYSLLREAVTSSAVQMVQQAGITQLQCRDRSYGPASTKFRFHSDRLLAAASGAHKGLAGPRHDEQEEQEKAEDLTEEGATACQAHAAAVERYLAGHAALAPPFASAWRLIQENRNKLNHCWTGDRGREKFNKGSLGEMAAECKQAVKAVQQLVTLLSSAMPQHERGGASAGTHPGAADSSPSLPPFRNFSNHSVGTWSPAQLNAARALGLGEPADLPGGMPQVPPAVGTEEIERLAAELVERGGAGLEGACVFGEFSLSVALLRQLQRQGVRCFAATTERKVVERMREDGTVEKQSEFSFVRWREYTGE